MKVFPRPKRASGGGHMRVFPLREKPWLYVESIDYTVSITLE